MDFPTIFILNSDYLYFEGMVSQIYPAVFKYGFPNRM